jgi:hypothetical protein
MTVCPVWSNLLLKFSTQTYLRSKIAKKENVTADEKDRSLEKTKDPLPPKPPAVEELSESDVENVAGGAATQIPHRMS